MFDEIVTVYKIREKFFIPRKNNRNQLYIFFVAPGQISIKPNEIIFYSALMCMHNAYTHTHIHAVHMEMEKFSPQALQ